MQNSPATDQTTAWNTEAVSEFVTGDADVLVLDRQPLDKLAPVIEAARVHEFTAPVSRETAGFEVRGGLRELRLKSPELTADLISLVNTFLDQFDLKEARLRIEITRSQSCPKFHCDNVNVRVVTTFVGPTTEYQHAGESTVHSVSLGGLVFLTNYRDSVHHRSPEVSADERRLCVAIDY